MFLCSRVRAESGVCVWALIDKLEVAKGKVDIFHDSPTTVLAYLSTLIYTGTSYIYFEVRVYEVYISWQHAIISSIATIADLHSLCERSPPRKKGVRNEAPANARLKLYNYTHLYPAAAV